MLKIQWILVTLLSLFVMRNFRSTCPPVEMLVGYMVKKRLESPVTEYRVFHNC